MSKIKLDTSWEEKSNELFYPADDIDFASYKGFLDGAKSFQKRAIEELKKEIDDSLSNPTIESLDTMFNGGLETAIEIIKNLKV